MTDVRGRRVALVTGVGRLNGIAPAVAGRLAAAGHDLALSGHLPYDRARYGSEDRTGELVGEPVAAGADATYVPADRGEPDAPARPVTAAVERYGHVDTLAAVHAHSVHTPLDTVTAEQIDRHLNAKVRGTLLLVQAYAAAHRSAGAS